MTIETLYDEHMDEARPNPMLICTESMQRSAEIEKKKHSGEETIETLYDEDMDWSMDEISVDILESRLFALRRRLEKLKSMTTRYREDTRSEVNFSNRLNQMNTTRIKPFQHNYEVYDDNILYTEQALDWDGKYVEVDEPFSLEIRKLSVQLVSSFLMTNRLVVEPLDVPGYYVMQKHKDRKYFFITLQKYGAKKCVEIDDWDGKMTSQLQDKSTCWNPNIYVELDEPFNLEKRKKAVQRVSSFVIVTTAFLWIITDICGQLSPIQVQQEHGSLFIWSSLLEILSFMAFVCAILAMIVVGARFSHLQRIMLMFWAIWMQVKSAKSLTAVSPPILGILFTGWHVLMEKQPPHEE